MKPLNTLFAILLAGASALAAPVAAQTATSTLPGTWKVYPVFQERLIIDMAETPGNLYFISGRCLWKYDKTAGTTTSFGKDNGFNGVFVNDVEYCPALGLVVAGSKEGMIDIIDDKTGEVTSLTDLKNARLTADRAINAMAISGKELLVSAEFGVAVFDLEKKRLTKYGDFTAVSGDSPQYGPKEIATDGNRYFAVWDDGILRMAPASADLKDSQQFEPVTYSNGNQITSVARIFSAEAGKLYYINNFSSATDLPPLWPTTNSQLILLTFSDDYTSYTSAICPQKSGGLVWKGGNSIYATLLSASGTNGIYQVDDIAKPIYLLTSSDATGYLRSASASTYGEIIWTGGYKGIQGYQKYGNSPEVTTEKMRPTEPYTSSRNPTFFRRSADGKRLYIGTHGSGRWLDFEGNSENPEFLSFYINHKDYEDYYQPYRLYGWVSEGYLDMVENGNVTPWTIYEPFTKNGTHTYSDYQGFATNGPYRVLPQTILGVDGFEENPKKPGELWIASVLEGLYKTQDGKEVAIYSKAAGNMPARDAFGALFKGCTFDRDGNLWVIEGSNNNPVNGYAYLYMLPASKVNQESISSNDWLLADKNCFTPDDRLAHSRIYALKHTNANWIAITPSRRSEGRLHFHKNINNDDISGDKWLRPDYLIDQFGNPYPSMDVTSLYEEESSNRLWVSGENYIGLIDDLEEQLEQNPTTLRFTRMVVPGSSSDLFTQMYFDVVKAKDGTYWIGTYNGGVYQVALQQDAVGDDYTFEVINHFTTENSPLPTNIAPAVSADIENDIIYIGTMYGLVAYKNGKGFEASDFTDVQVSPSPVPSGYRGWFNITNLPSGQTVSIVNAAGTTVYTATSEAGQVKWDGTDSQGKRVQAGVYTIKAATGTPDATGIVGRIVIPE